VGQSAPELLQRLHWAKRIGWSRALKNSASIAAKKEGTATGLNPTNRGKAGTKRHLASG